MKCTDHLSKDHKLILRGLEILRAMEIRMERHHPVQPEDVEGLLEFFRAFSDRCHHSKEEAIFFPALIRAGILCQGGPVAVMLYEHDQGRSLVDGMDDALKRKDAADFISFATRYIEVLTNHIHKEDHILFEIAADVLTDENDLDILKEFEKVELDFGGEVHERFSRMIQGLEFRYLGKSAVA